MVWTGGEGERTGISRFLLGRLLFSGRRRSDKADNTSFDATRGRPHCLRRPQVEREKDMPASFTSVESRGLEQATKFYEECSGIYQTKTGYRAATPRGHDDQYRPALMLRQRGGGGGELSGTRPASIMGHPRSRTARRPSGRSRERRQRLLRSGGGALKFRRARRQPRRDRRRRAATRRGQERESRIVHVALKVQDLERATKFYENVFGSAMARPQPAATSHAI